MIAASEPVEFIPRGRQAVGEHPGPLVKKKQINYSTEPMLLHRLQNVNISSDDSSNEFWCVQEIFKENADEHCALSASTGFRLATDLMASAEHELYVMGTTAVWTKGICDGGDDQQRRLPSTCFTCDTPIRYALFCPSNFFKSQNPNKRLPSMEAARECDIRNGGDAEEFGICLIDSTSMRVYSSCGEDFRTSLEFAVSNVWQTKTALLLERNASATMVENESIAMPRLFSITHPLNELCPVLFKSITGAVNLLTESDFTIVFSNPENDLIMLFDYRSGKHFLAKLRETTAEEKQAVAGKDESAVDTKDTLMSSFNFSNNSDGHSFMQATSFGDAKPKNVSSLNRSGLNSTPKMHNMTPNSYLLHSQIAASPNRSQMQSPYDRLPSSCGQNDQLDTTRKQNQAKPSKPVVPELCLEYIWSETNGNKDYSEVASRGFMHVDLIGQTYVCYLLARSANLMLTRIEKSSSSEKPILGMLANIPAKDAICLNSQKLMVILAPCGTLMIYTGPHMIAKVHVGGTLSSRQPHPLLIPSNNTSFPRRSSLLPTVKPTVETSLTSFDEDVHLLSPVYPLQTAHHLRPLNVCSGLRDAAGNRLTLVYSGNVMYRIAIPYLSECPLVMRCLTVLRQVLKKELSILLISKWYGVRNAPGSQDLSAEREWYQFQNVLLQLLGRPCASHCMFTSASNSSSLSTSSGEPKKRRKTDDCVGTDSDFHFLQAHCNKWRCLTDTTAGHTAADAEDPTSKRNDANALLFAHIPIVFLSLHLLYEEMKIDESLRMKLGLMADFLNQLAMDLRLDAYCVHYFLDYPELIATNVSCAIDDADKAKLLHSKYLSLHVPNVFKTVNDWIDGKQTIVPLYPHIPNVNPMCRNIVKLVALIATQTSMAGTFSVHSSAAQPFADKNAVIEDRMTANETSARVLKDIIEFGMTRNDINRLPAAIHYLLAAELEKCRTNTPMDCDPKAFELLLRPELYSNTMQEAEKEKINYYNFKNENSLSPKVQANADTDMASALNNDGMSHIHTKLLRLRFAQDLRVDEVRRILASANPVVIDLTQKIGISDHDFIEEKEKQLLAMCTRTMALPLGRGMMTLRTSTPAATESMAIPKLCLTGKEKDKGATIELQQIELPQNMSMWPLFHNGVAAGLQLTPDCKDVDSTWIVYNKPKVQSDSSTEHAGFLMALGLNGHLKTLSFMSIYEYLVKCDEMTSLGLILGISAAHRATMDPTTTKLLSVHIEALLPATALELDIPQNIQVAAIMGIGLLYQESAKRHIAEVLLQEIGRPPGPEMENCVERESYALTAGLALGLVTLGKGESPPGLKDLQLSDTLHYYMIGGNKRPLTGSQKEKYKLQSFQVREGDTVNIDVTAPGATLALGLMFFQTGNKTVANWMNPPDTSYLLDLVRPDLLLLKIIARGLILWNDIQPTSAWLNGQFPKSLQIDWCNGPDDLDSSNIDHEAICQAYCNIIAGGAFCIGLRFAGTANGRALKTLHKTFTRFLNMNGMYVGEYAGKSTVESCLILILIAMSLVSAGTGDLHILRICRMLRNRLGTNNSHVTYGSQMAIHMAVGFQFIGAGRFTLSRSPQSIAALICALFPKFPTHSNDNRYHLQAFRHLYVLAIEPRILLPRDIDSGKLCLCNVTYATVDGEVVSKMAPCILPELNQLASIRFDDQNYWLITFEKGKNWSQLERALSKCGCIDIKQKAGCVSHLEDPTNLRSFYAQTLTTEQYSCWKTHPMNLMTFSNDSTVRCFISKFIASESTHSAQTSPQMETIQLFTLQFYYCLVKDTMHALGIFVDLLMALNRIKLEPRAIDVWQIKILQTILQLKHQPMLLSPEQLNSLLQLTESHMEDVLVQYKSLLREFLFSTNMTFLQKSQQQMDALMQIAAIIVFHNIPNRLFDATNEQSGHANYLQLLTVLKKARINTNTIQMISRLLETSNDP